MTNPALLWNAPRPPKREPVPGELLFALRREPDGARLHCELRSQGEFGVEAQFFSNGEFSYSRRFDTKAQALQWAELERDAHIRKGYAHVTD
jgi:hypothetical protein